MTDGTDTASSLSRRTLLAAASGAAALSALPAVADEAAMVIEWNQHMFSRDVARFPFSPRASYRPDPSRFPEDPLAAYLTRMQTEGIDRAVLVQPEPYGDDHTLVLDCLARAPQRTKGTSLFYPRDADAPDKLSALVKAHPRIVANRFHAHRGKEMYLDSFADAGVRALWKRTVDLGLIVELHIGPNYALQVADAIRAFPGCTVLIEHMGEPKYGRIEEYANVLDLAQLPNVYMKLSELGNIATDPPYYESVRPFTRRLIQAFGPDRMVWGGGSPHIVDVHMQGYSQADIAKVKGGNLKRLLKW